MNAGGTLLMSVGAWLIAINTGAVHNVRAQLYPAVVVTIVLLGVVGAAIWLVLDDDGPLSQRLRDVGVNAVANLLAAGVVWLLLAWVGAIERGPAAAMTVLAVASLPLMLWFKFARDVGVNVLCSVVVLGAGWLLASAQGSVSSNPRIMTAATIAVCVPATALLTMAVLPRRFGRLALLRMISVELLANLLAASAIGIGLAMVGALRLNHVVAYFGLQIILLPFIDLLWNVAESLGSVGSAVVAIYCSVAYILFPGALHDILGKPDFRGFALFAVVCYVALIWAAVRRTPRRGIDERAERLWALAVFLSIPVLTAVGFAIDAIWPEEPDPRGSILDQLIALVRDRVA
ncbi:hypothetical protein AB0B31_35595 [Catellatospora citrea]|uniref:hypothetical protein n=1 Tax=Catellatospora citrea TaxID=53366 RepID=UPI0033FA7568